MAKDELLVVGAGPVGLAMAAALKRRGLPYVQVEAASGIGGNWHHGVYDTCHIVSSKRSTAYADFPMPQEYPDFPSGRQMLAYLNAFVDARGLRDSIRLNCAVAAAHPRADDSWTVRFGDGSEEIFKGIVACTGHHWDRRMPDLPAGFRGQVLHAKDYKRPAELAGKRVLVLGGGNSGCDLACEAARVGASCDWSLRRGYWFLPKTAFGRPLTDLPIWNLPEWAQRIALRTLVWIEIGDYRAYGLPWPDHRLFDRHPTFGSDALAYVRQGRIRPRGSITGCDGERVTFADGSSGEYDLIAAGTGYNYSIPFLPKGIVPVENDVVQVFGGAFPATVKNLYIVGFLQPRNGFGALITPAVELYARMIEMQDEIEHPIGAILQWRGRKPPRTPYINPDAARREIWLAHKILPILRITARRYARYRERLEAREAAQSEPGEGFAPFA